MQQMPDFEQWMRRAGFPRQRHQCFEQRAHRAGALDQSLTLERYPRLVRSCLREIVPFAEGPVAVTM